MKNKIFVSIASYRDPELVPTIMSAIDNCSSQSELFFGIVLQELPRYEPDLSWVPNLSIIKMHPRDARGVGFARSKTMMLYNNQDYYLQIDSHTRFAKNWDLLCLDQYNKAKKISQHNNVILSYFPAPFHVENNGDVSFPTKIKEQPPYPTKQVPFLNKRSDWTAKRIELSNNDTPELSSTVLAGFIFSNGKIVNEIPYDPEISFFGEEICFAMRAWTRGWDIYSPTKNIVYHFYSRAGYSKIWKDRNIRNLSWKEIESFSKEKQKKVLCGIETGIFGYGDKRSLKSYEELIGFDFKKMYGLTKEHKSSTISL